MGPTCATPVAVPVEPVDGHGKVLLAVRDLASRYTVGWNGLTRGSCREVSAVIERLMRRNGAPLVLKSDNGSAFTDAAFKSTQARFGVAHLRSPRAWPQYNGACEAGIGVLKALTDTAATSRGEPDQWTTDDLEEARARANDLSRNIGARLVSAREEWARRRRDWSRGRVLLKKATAERWLTLRKSVPNPHRHRSRLRRKAIQEAFVELRHLHVTSRWIRVRSTGRGSTPSYR